MSKNVFTPEFQEAMVSKINNAEDKSIAIVEAMEMMVAASNSDLVDSIVKEANENRMAANKGFRPLSESEKKFYNGLKAGAKQSVTADQIDIIPVETIDWTLNEIKQDSGITRLITFAPAGVKKWLTASKTGTAAWGGLTDEIVSELTATIEGTDMDAHKLSAFCLIPKAIRDLEIGYVDKYFTAILEEAMRDGFAAGYLYGDGKTAPIGLAKKISQVNQDGTHTAKTKVATVTGFSPAALAPHLKTLSHNGIRKIEKLYVICNPLDRYQYVNPALYGDSFVGGWVDKSFMPIEVIEDANVTQGDGFLTIEGVFTMGFRDVMVDEYKETKAVEDCDLIIAKVYGNGRAVDDDAAVYFNITKLEEYVPTVKNVAEAGE